MAKHCEYCGNKNGFLVVDEFYISNDKILCEKCAEKIRSDINSIYYVKSDEEFNLLKTKILNKCNEQFNQDITEIISNLIDEKYNQINFAKNSKTTSSGGMFSNIGAKLKTLAEVLTWIGIIFSVISGIILISNESISGIFVIIIGCFISWISSFVLYGFGQLVENSSEILKKLK